MVAEDILRAQLGKTLQHIDLTGLASTTLTAHWFEETRHVAPNHVIDVPAPNVLRAIECRPLLVQMVVRACLTGVTPTSSWKHNKAGSRFYAGHWLPDGMRKNQALPRPLVTPSTQAEKGAHDGIVSRQDLIDRGLLDATAFDEFEPMCLAMFAFGQERAPARGLILVDTKYELGRVPDGRILFIDEIHTPDSSRYWYAEDYEAVGDRLLSTSTRVSISQECWQRAMVAVRRSTPVVLQRR